MFSLFNRSQKTKEGTQLPAALRALLDEPLTEAVPLVLSEVADIRLDGRQLRIELPFPAGFVQKPLQDKLQAADLPYQLQLSWGADESYVFGKVRQLVLVASGKGGVGKSTTAVNLAVALTQQGAKVGLLDADIYGPSVPLMLGEQTAKATSPDEKHLNPLHKYGIFMQSIGFLVDPDNATVWRGPMAAQALMQLVNETLWPELDYLIVDMPPGTGDIQLTLSQKLNVSAAVIVTTPQDVALADAKKAVQMFRQVNIPLAGLIENISFYQCPHCGEADDIFGTEGGRLLAERYQLPVLGQLPLHSDIRRHGDEGRPIALEDNNQTAEIYRKIARELILTLYWQTEARGKSQVEIIMTDD